MTAYAQWRGTKRSCEAVQLTWVCGPELVLADEVVTHVSGCAGAAERSSLSAGDWPEPDVWAVCSQYSEERRLVVIREAERLTSWSLLPDVAAAGTFVVFVSAHDEEALAAEPGAKRVLYPGVAAVKALRGQVVRCALGDANEAERIAWVQRRLPGASREMAWEIMARSGGDLALAAGACDKIRLAWPGGSAAPHSIVPVILHGSVRDAAADLLIAGRRADALSVLGQSGPEGLIGLLATRLDSVALLHEAKAAGMSQRAACEQTGVPRLTMARLWPVAGDYDPARVGRLRLLLARLDRHYQGGARAGVGEALVALW